MNTKRTVDDDICQEIQDTYGVFQEKFILNVFEDKKRLRRAEWKEKVYKKYSYLFNPAKIRRVLGYEPETPGGRHTVK